MRRRTYLWFALATSIIIKTLVYLMTKGAGITEKGEPYEARFLDKFGNLCVRYGARPQVIPFCFQYSNIVDVHNLSRQVDLSLEKKWVKEDCYFRIYTTILGIILTDTWKLFWDRHYRGFRKVSIIEFADILAKELIDQAKAHQAFTVPVTNITNPRNTEKESQVLQLSTTVCKLKNSIHTQDFLKGGKQLWCIWCSRVNLVERKTTSRCLESKKSFYRNHCWSHHVTHSGVPVAPKYGTKKRKREWSVNLFLFFGGWNFYDTTHCLSRQWEMTLQKACLQLGQEKRGWHSPLEEQTHRLWSLLQKEVFSH